MVPLTLTVVVVAALLTVVPMDDASYQCEASPISLFLEPAAEHGGDAAFFFDQAAACNSDARTRVAWTGAIAITGLVLTLGMSTMKQTPRQPSFDVAP